MEINFYLMTNAESDVCSSTVRCVERARWFLAPRGVNFIWDIAQGYGQNKSKCVSVSKFFLDSQIPYLISIDRDMLFEAEHLEKLYNNLKNGYDLISGIYCLRNGKRLSGYPGKDKSSYILDGSILEFQYIPLGFTGISRQLLKRMVNELQLPLLGKGENQFYPFFEQKVSEEMNELCGDDTSLCEKAHQIGVKAYVDTSIQLGHFGDKIYTIQDFIDYQQKQEKEKTNGI